MIVHQGRTCYPFGMGGCTDCHNKGGCEQHKGEQRVIIDEVLARIYPERLWGRPEDAERFGQGVPRGEVRRLAQSLSERLQAPTFFRAGSDEDLCDFVYVLCVGREPALVEVREGRAEADGTAVNEKYLRVCVSSVARLAAVQEVELVLAEALITELPRAGVFDPLLLKRMQKLVAQLESSAIHHLDFGLLEVPLEGAQPGDYLERYGTAPMLANYLFFAAPATTSTHTSL